MSAFLRALDLNPQYAEAREQLEAVQLEQLQVHSTCMYTLTLLYITFG